MLIRRGLSMKNTRCGRHNTRRLSTNSTLQIKSHVVSNNASNMVKAFKLPGYIANSHSDSKDTSDTDGSSDTELDDDGPSDVFAHFPQHDGCFAHTVQLVVKDGMKAAGTLRSVIGKASNIVSHARKSTISTELLDGHRKLQAANVTRWNTRAHHNSVCTADPSGHIGPTRHHAQADPSWQDSAGRTVRNLCSIWTSNILHAGW